MTDPTLDLSFEREVPISAGAAFLCWTEPALLVKWFTPAPWKTVHAEVEARPGGRFVTEMESPEGQRMPPGVGCVLEAVPGRRFSWTSALLPGFRPAGPPPEGGFHMTATLEFHPGAQGCLYRATVRHPDEGARARHEAMGFHAGWGKALEQLVALARAQSL